MSYKKLEIWQHSRTLVIDIHKITLTKLPKFEIYDDLHSRLTTMGAKLNKFLASVEAGHISPK
jgi:hypothetical protein